jgi:hypothetical protein
MAKKGPKKGSKRTYEHTIKMDGEEIGNYEPRLTKRNHLKQGKIYDDFCFINQEFLKYILSIKLTKNEYSILLFLLSYMDNDNKIIVDAEIIEYHLGIGKTNVNKYISKLEDKKVIYKRNLGYKKGQEVLLNFDIISPHFAYRNPNSQEKVSSHKSLMNIKESPYQKQTNAFTNEIDYINPATGEVFHTSKKK